MEAEAVLQEAWVVNVRARPESLETLNEAFNACYEAERACPAQNAEGRGTIAIVLDDAVLSAPAVNGLDLADDSFTISGDFDEQTAKDLAAMLSD
jgi:preprotein translocase subunit SecD